MNVIERLALCFALLVCFASGRAQIAFQRRNALYVIACDQTGRPAPGAKPIHICRFWPMVEDDSVNIQWTPDGRIAITHFVEAMNGPTRFGLDRSDNVSGIWLVGARAGARPTKLADGFDPSFSPDGSRMTYSSGQDSGDIWMLDLKTHTKKRLVKNGTQFCWCPNGREVAFVRVSDPTDFSKSVEVRSFPELRLLRTIPAGVSPCELIFSPDGSRIAVHFHLSRPLTGHAIFNVKDGKESELQCPPGIAPPIVDDWSADGSLLLCDWRAPDPNNDGSWIKDYVALVGPSGKGRKLHQGSGAQFSDDGRHVLYMNRSLSRQGDLIWSSLDGTRSIVVVHGIKQFAVCRKLPLLKAVRPRPGSTVRKGTIPAEAERFQRDLRDLRD